ncbi:MAG: dihydroorotase [Pleurocapsa sp.]
MELLRQVRIIDPSQGIDRLADVLISEGKIAAIDTEIVDYPPETEIFEPANLVLGTGLADLYSHSGEPGNEARETLATLAASAAAGGFTQVAILPDTEPAMDNIDVLTAIQQKSQRLRRDYLCQLHFWGAIVPSDRTKQMNELGELKTGAIGFSDRFDFGNLNLFKQVLEYLKPWQKPVAISLADNELTNNGVIREGEASLRYGVPGNPSFSEAAIIAAVLEIVAVIGTPVHIMRVSTQRGVELIADAKQRGIPVTASTTWMHLLFNSEVGGSYDPNLRLEPPLGNQNDLNALIDGVKQGIIDAIAIDNHAYTYEEKTVPFGVAPPGAIGLELALPILWQRFVTSGIWSPLELWQALSSRPRQCLQQQPPSISPQQPAELVLFDPQASWTVNQQNITATAANTPWWNQEITGRVIKIWHN